MRDGSQRRVYVKTLRLLNNLCRVATANVRTLHDGVDPTRFTERLLSITTQLQQLRIGLCALSESRLRGSGEQRVQAQPSASWMLLHSGRKEIRQHGVALLLDHTWQAALLAWTPYYERHGHLAYSSFSSTGRVVHHSTCCICPNRVEQHCRTGGL